MSSHVQKSTLKVKTKKLIENKRIWGRQKILNPDTDPMNHKGKD